MRGFWAPLPDAQATEQDALAEGDRVTLRLVVRAIQLGKLWGLAPTGRVVQWNATTICRFVDGKVAQQWANEDWLAILIGIGHVTPPWAD